MSRRLGAALAVLALVAAAPAGVLAEEEEGSHGTFGLRMQSFRPGVDSEFGGDGAYARVFGETRGWAFRAEAARTLLDRWGAVDLGLGAGWFQASGHGLMVDATSGETVESADTTRLTLLPLTLFLAYRLDLVPRHTGLPFEPYVRLGLERYLWWTDADGGSRHSGATDGWSFTAGTALLLDGLDREGSRALARDAGIRHTALTVDVTRARVDDFGSSRSWTLSDPGWSVGLGLQFGF